MADPWNTHAQHLDKTVVLATDTLFKAVDANPDMSPEAFQAVCAEITRRYGTVAVSSALWALDTGRMDAGQDQLPAPVPADPVNVAQVSSSASWAVNKAEGNIPAAARVMAGPLGRLVRQPARETVWESTAAAGSRYVRVPGANACAFCLMLASRGAVYTKSSVLTTGGGYTRKGDARVSHTRNPAASGGHRFTTGQRAEGQKYHDHCSCTARESFSDADLPQIVKDLQDEWYDVTWDDNGPLPGQAKVWEAHIAGKRKKVRDRDMFLASRDAGKIDTALDMRHLTSYKVAKKTKLITGGHIAQQIPPIATEVRNGTGKLLPDGKTFFPDMTDQELAEWLNGEDGIARVLADPEVIQKNGKWGYWVFATVPSPAGGTIELVVQCGGAKKNSGNDYRVTSAFPRRGDGVKVVLPNGDVEERGWPEEAT